MKSLKNITLLLLITLMTSGASGSLPLEPNTEFTKIAKTLAHELPQAHLSRHDLDDSISKQMLENYLSILDRDRIYFQKSDIERFNAKETLLDDELRLGDVDFAYEVFGVLKERVKNRNAYVATLLEQGFDLTIDEDYYWKRKDDKETALKYYQQALIKKNVGEKTLLEAEMLFEECGKNTERLQIFSKNKQMIENDSRLKLACVIAHLANECPEQAWELLKNGNFSLCEGKMLSRSLYEQTCQALAEKNLLKKDFLFLIII
jgi:hypothetical protein